ncbi:hypothetical protein GBAR_LOCUS24156 [Geodia barretti]|uniref:Uncharacterized protein n=1 Tax=Geodia barretti TaxID=519541 RepID=A0AA35X8L7_GEOBA|nr:hypothetical protein GBAR_LOCUS24156 [Geodia barretti]
MFPPGSRVKRKKRTVANEYTEMLATSPPPSGTTGGRTTTSFTYHYEDPVSPSDSLGRYTIAQSTTRATNDCPPAPGLQASPPQSTHLNEEPVSPSRPESPEGTPPPVPPYRGSSPELHSSLSTLPLVKVNSPESIACGPTGASYCGSQPVPPEDPAPPKLPPRPPAKPPAKVTGKHRLEYADVVPQQSSRGNPILPPPPSGRDNTVYSEVRTDLKVDVATTVNKYDRCVTLDNIMRQIRPLAHKWSNFANFLELQDPGMPDIHNDWEYPNMGEVSGLVRHSGFPELADAINRVYVTGIVTVRR